VHVDDLAIFLKDELGTLYSALLVEEGEDEDIIKTEKSSRLESV